MYIIKLNAIDSTNTYLKELCSKQAVENFTTVIAENQTNGKGQRGSNWETEIGKNLTFSVLIKDLLLNFEEVFNLNILIAVSLHEIFLTLKIPNLLIKWPNDILSEKKKFCGILIENQFKSNQEIISVIGIGINVNQIEFENLPQATSLKKIMNKDFDKDEILLLFLNQFKSNVNLYKKEGASCFWKKYHQNLFKRDIPMVFEDNQNQKFMGIIKQVTPNGLLEIQLEDESLKTFDIKEIKMLY